VYADLKTAGVDVLYDDRDARAGEKFADSDLIGIPYRVVISKKLHAEAMCEIVERQTGVVTNVSVVDMVRQFGTVK
jgi:prolyl-tRNA synthetase